jgi:hypothetical protein
MEMTFIPRSASSSSQSSQSSSQLVSECSLTEHASFPISLPLGFDDPAVSPDDRLASALKAYERLLRQTLSAGSNLVTVAVEAQANRGLDPTAGHQIYHAFNAANLDISNALSNTARGHRQLDTLAQAMGIDITSYGKTQPMPAPGFTDADASDRVVDC